MTRQFYLPNIALLPYVDRYWCNLGREAAAGQAWVLPGTGAELMFVTEAGPGGIALASGLPPAFLLCVRTQAYQIPVPLRAMSLFSVRIRSGALRHFCRIPMQDLFDAPIPLREIWADAGEFLSERISQAQSDEQRVAILDQWLLAQLHKHARENAQIEMAIWHLYYRHQQTRIETLAEQLGMSRRQFERLFRQQLGMTPKSFQRTARFHSTVRDLLLAEQGLCLDVALSHGYYDQSHFIHEFESFVGCSPLRFLGELAEKAHFYNTPLFAPDTVPLPL